MVDSSPAEHLDSKKNRGNIQQKSYLGTFEGVVAAAQIILPRAFTKVSNILSCKLYGKVDGNAK